MPSSRRPSRPSRYSTNDVDVSDIDSGSSYRENGRGRRTYGGISVSTVDISGDSDYDYQEKERRAASARKARRRKTSASEEASLEDIRLRKEDREEKLAKAGKSEPSRRRRKSTNETPIKKKSSTGTKETTVKKRRRKTTGELIASGNTAQAQKRLGKLSSKAVSLSEHIDIDPTDILPPLVTSEFTTEHEFLKEYEHIYETQSTIIRRLEERLTDVNSSISSRDIYALSTMYSQMRETISDMRSIKDMSAQAEALAANVFDPAMKAAGESLVSIFFKMQSALRHHVKDLSVIEILMEKFKQDIAAEGAQLQNQLTLSREKILEVLAEV